MTTYKYNGYESLNDLFKKALGLINASRVVDFNRKHLIVLLFLKAVEQTK